MVLKDEIPHQFEAMIERRSEKAIMIRHEGDNMWLPLSQIELEPIDEADNFYSITVPIWLAIKKGLIEKE